MKKTNYYFTLFLVLFTTIFSFFNMFRIVSISKDVISIVFNNLLPSLLPFMILISLCLSLGLTMLFNYVIQWIFAPIFHLTPHMSTIYFLSFFCGYPTNAKIMKEAYELHYINIEQLQHLLSIASFSSLSFIFVSLKLDFHTALFIYLCHIIPSLIKALFYFKDYQLQTFSQTMQSIKDVDHSFIKAIKKSMTSSLYAFIFILGYMLVFQFVGYSLGLFIKNPFIITIIQGLLEFSSGSLRILQYHHILTYPLICFFLSFSGISVLMQVDNLLEDIPYSFKKYFIARLFHGIVSFSLCFILQILTNILF
jgi:Nucleoside recognition.